MKPLAAILSLVFTFSSHAAGPLDKLDLVGSSWICLSGGQELGTVTFQEGGRIDSWRGPGEWKKTATGLELFGVAMDYGANRFSGRTAAGVEFALIPVPELDETKIENLESLKIASSLDHRFTISGKTIAWGKGTDTVWQTSWGSYQKEFEREALIEFEVRHLGEARDVFFEVLHLARSEADGSRYGYVLSSRNLRNGSRPAGWLAWVRSGDTIMGLVGSRGALVDEFERNPGELLRYAKAAAK